MTSKPLTQAEKRDWLRLARTRNIGPVAFFQLKARFGSVSAALEALPDLSARSGRKLTPPPLEEIEKELEAAKAAGATCIAACEEAYPPLLKRLDPPPPVLFATGDPALAARPCVAIVGARNASAPGRRIARDMAAALGEAGYVVVSGLARGIDGEAHAGALRTGTVAVLAGGVDHIYPPQHKQLYEEVAAKGLIFSERPMGARAVAKDFPRRNRIVTGCSAGVVVVEAAERSGSLISARMAGEQGREVMACPGSPLEPRSAGANRLIRDGALLVRDAGDVIAALEGLGQRSLFEPAEDIFSAEPAAEPPEDAYDRVHSALSHTPASLDDISRAAALTHPQCAAILTELELSGRAETLPGGLAMLKTETGGL